MKLLIVDFMDSYSYSIPAFLHQACSESTRLTIHIRPFNTLDENSVESTAATYDGVILSAGPGTVERGDDLGSFTPALLSLRPAIPVHGICLGFQAICRHFGGTIHRLPSPHHGLVSEILDPAGSRLGRKATRYHSLEVRLGEYARQQIDVLAVARNHDDPENFSAMEVKHHSLPFWGVQYHPESVYSEGCEVTVQPFLEAAQSRCTSTSPNTSGVTLSNAMKGSKSTPFEPDYVPVAWKSIQYGVDLLDLLPMVQCGSTDFVLLDSSSKGEWSILATAKTASLFRYSVRDRRMIFKSLRGHGESGRDRRMNIDVRLFNSRQIHRRAFECSVLGGGFVGYFGYELGLQEMGLDPYKSNPNHIPEYGDIQLLWSTETLVYHPKSKALYAISLNRDYSWVENILEYTMSCKQYPEQRTNIPWANQYKIDHPDEQSYVKSIKEAQEQIKSGNSYELFLTATSITKEINSSSSETEPGSTYPADRTTSTQRFRALRENNPASFMSFLKLGGVEMLSASPEEFLSYNAQTAIARMKPIKGTLPKKDEKGNPITIEMARKLLHEPKVIAENLVIVDLVRHDLSRVSEKVSCPDLMRVEDIGPMYQLISTVQAEVRKDCTAWDLIRRSIPPGSMTGAPKRRSCEILQCLERNHRGLYSGITGYIDVRGHCRTSVNIRNMVRYPGERHWRIGAGGAITSLSNPADEWNERQLKASSVCRSLVPSFSVLETILWDPKTGRLLYWEEHMKRLLKTIRHFGFNTASPKLEEDNTNQTGPTDTATEAIIKKDLRSSDESADSEISERLSSWIIDRLYASNQQGQILRLSLEVDVSGSPTLTSKPIPATPDAYRINVHLDPCAVRAGDLEHFITYKTTNRTHYVSARDRASVDGRDEVLMFRPDRQSLKKGQSSVILGSATDWLTEGSYTNVAFWNSCEEKWYTPSTGCLPGVMREKMLESGEIAVGDLQRRHLTIGTVVMLFNSVRGVFEGVIKK